MDALEPDDQVFKFFPDKAPENLSYKQKSMRIRDLLTMNTGHIDEPTVWFSDGDWVQFFLTQEVPLIPGTHFKYNSPATYMMSAIIQKVLLCFPIRPTWVEVGIWVRIWLPILAFEPIPCRYRGG